MLEEQKNNMGWKQFLIGVLGTSGLSAIVVAIINKCPNFKIKRKKKKINYSKVVRKFKKLLKKYNLVNVSESMIYVIFNVLNSGQLNIYQCTDKESECIINMLLKENYLYITQKKEYKWNRKQEELVVLLDYYYKLTKLD